MSASRKSFGVLFSLLLLVAPMVAVADTTTAVVDESVIKVTPSKVCQPGKPITCRATDLVPMEETLPVQAAASCQSPFANSLETITKPQLESQEAGLCYGPRWLCFRDIDK